MMNDTYPSPSSFVADLGSKLAEHGTVVIPKAVFRKAFGNKNMSPAIVESTLKGLKQLGYRDVSINTTHDTKVTVVLND